MGHPGPWAMLGILVLALGSTSGGSGEGVPRAATGGRLPELVHIALGSRAEPGRPEGWSHRVVRSVPRLATGDLTTLPESASTTATLFRTVIAADVERRMDGTYALERIGVGNAVPVGPREVVVTPEGPDEALATLGVVERVVLRAAESELRRGKLIARTPTFALYRAPTTLLVEGRHEDVEIHYAFLVDAETGALTTLCWATGKGKQASPREVVLLQPDATFDAALDVQVSRRVGPVPVAWSFAMRSLPPGRAIDVPSTANAALAEADRPDPDPLALERSLRMLVAPSEGR